MPPPAAFILISVLLHTKSKCLLSDTMSAEQKKLASRRLSHWLENDRRIVRLTRIRSGFAQSSSLVDSLGLELIYYHRSHIEMYRERWDVMSMSPKSRSIYAPSAFSSVHSSTHTPSRSTPSLEPCFFISSADSTSLLLEHLTAHPKLNATYLLTGHLLPTSSLASTQLPADTQDARNKSGSLRDMAGTQMVRIVDMDEMSDADRNSEDDMTGLEDEEGDVGMGNDEGADDGIGGGSTVEGVKVEEKEVRAEQVTIWGVVLVQSEGLKGELISFKAGKGRD